MELLFFILLVLASVLDASGRRKKRQRRMEEMEAEEAQDEGAVGTLERAPKETPRPEPPGADRTSTAPSRRDTADSMIPEELWSILTGQAPPDRPERPEPTPESTAEPTPTYEAWGGEEVDDLHRPEREPAPSPLRSAPAPITSGPIATNSLTETGSGSVADRRQNPRSGAASRYAALLKGGGRDSLRTAVVLKEILDSPPGLRAPGEIGAAGGRRPDS